MNLIIVKLFLHYSVNQSGTERNVPYRKNQSLEITYDYGNIWSNTIWKSQPALPVPHLSPQVQVKTNPLSANYTHARDRHQPRFVLQQSAPSWLMGQNRSK